MRTMSKEKFAEITGATGKTLDELYTEYLEVTFNYGDDDDEDVTEENEAYLYSVFESEEEMDEYFFGHDTKD